MGEMVFKAVGFERNLFFDFYLLSQNPPGVFILHTLVWRLFLVLRFPKNQPFKDSRFF